MDYTGILIKGHEGKLLFQLRDNNPNIQNKGLWSLFGGGIEPGETPINAAIRELKEELGIKVKKGDLHLWKSFHTSSKKRYIFKLNLKKDIKDLKLGEGESMGFFTILEMLKKKNVVRSLKFLLLIYFISSLLERR